MSSKFVEFVGELDNPVFLRADSVDAVDTSDESGQSHAMLKGGAITVEIKGTPAEVVAKLQGEPLSGVLNNVAAPPAESEAVQLLERWVEWNGRLLNASGRLEDLKDDTRALLAKLKGGA